MILINASMYGFMQNFAYGLSRVFHFEVVSGFFEPCGYHMLSQAGNARRASASPHLPLSSQPVVPANRNYRAREPAYKDE
jgi:hypothetical protein